MSNNTCDCCEGEIKNGMACGVCKLCSDCFKYKLPTSLIFDEISLEEWNLQYINWIMDQKIINSNKSIRDLTR